MTPGRSTEVRANATATRRTAQFEDVLLDSIDSAIRGVLGETPWRALFDRTGGQVRLCREEIPEHLQDFTVELKRIFGQGATVMTRAIIRDLCGRLGIQYIEKGNVGFKVYVEDCKKRYESLGVDAWS